MIKGKECQHLGREEYDRLLKGNFSYLLDCLTNSGSHIEAHILCGIPRLCDEVLSGSKRYSSTFIGKYNDVRNLLKDALLTEPGRMIFDEVRSSKSSSPQKFSISLGRTIGYGLTIDRDNLRMLARKTNRMTIIARRNPNMKFGFSIVTAYPDIKRSRRKIEISNLKERVVSSYYYRDSLPLERAYIDLLAEENPPFHVNFSSNSRYDMMYIHCSIPGSQHDGIHEENVICLVGDRSRNDKLVGKLLYTDRISSRYGHIAYAASSSMPRSHRKAIEPELSPCLDLSLIPCDSGNISTLSDISALGLLANLDSRKTADSFSHSSVWGSSFVNDRIRNVNEKISEKEKNRNNDFCRERIL